MRARASLVSTGASESLRFTGCEHRPYRFAMRRPVAVLLVSAVVMVAGVVGVSAAPFPLPSGDLPAWSPSGRQIAYVVRSGPQSRQYDRVMLTSPSLTRVLAQFGRSVFVNEVRFAGNSRLVVALAAQGALCSIDIRTRKVIPLGPAVGGLGDGTCEQRAGPLSLGADDTFTVSADGRRVAYVADSPYENDNTAQTFGGDFAIGVASSLSGPWSTLSEPINASDEQPSFSPDGMQLVFARSLLAARTASAPSLMLQSVEGGQARRCTSRAPTRCGRRMAAGSHTSTSRTARNRCSPPR
jgi:Tol biopolymer transport system component